MAWIIRSVAKVGLLGPSCSPNAAPALRTSPCPSSKRRLLEAKSPGGGTHKPGKRIVTSSWEKTGNRLRQSPTENEQVILGRSHPCLHQPTFLGEPWW